MAHLASLAQTAYLTSMASSERTENETVGVPSMELGDSCTMQMIYLVALAVCSDEDRSQVGNKRKQDFISSSNNISPNSPTSTVTETVDALIVTLKTCASLELIITNCAGGGGGGMSSGSIQNISTVDLEKVDRALRLPIVSQGRHEYSLSTHWLCIKIFDWSHSEKRLLFQSFTYFISVLTLSAMSNTPQCFNHG